MNKKFMIGGCAAIAIAGNVFAGDEDYSYFNPYASLKGGYAFLGKRNDIKYKGGAHGGIEFGVSYDEWRIGLELGYKSNKIKDFKLPGGEQGTNFILNGGYDLAAGGANIESHDVHDVAGVAASTIAIGDKSVTVLWGNGGGSVPIYDLANGAVGNGQDRLLLRNVTEMKFEKMNALTGMLNVCYDYAMTEAWSMYAGVGLGVARVNLTVAARNSGASVNTKLITPNAGHGAVTKAAAEAAVLAALPKFFDGNNAKWNKTELSKTVFAWQLMAGVGYEFSENWKLTLGYKLFNTAKVKQTFAGKEYKIKTPFNHTLEAGLTYTF